MGIKRKERHEEKAATTMASFEEEEDFPRGGANALTAAEVQETRAEAEAEFASELFKGRRRKSSLPRSKHVDPVMEPGELFGEARAGSKSVSTLRFKGLSVGMKVWGAVAEINKKDLVVSLPNGLRGFVRAEETNDLFAESIVTSSAKKKRKSGTDHSDAMSKEEQVPLKDIFSVGQLVACFVLNLENTIEKGEKKGSRRIALSLRLSHVYEGLAIDVLHEGLQMVGCVRSVEDHGYLLSFGAPGISGFLLHRDYQNGNAALKLKKGQLVQGIVTAVDSARSRVSLKSNPELLASSAAKDHEALTLGQLLPGVMVNAQIRSVLKNGLLLNFLTYFNGTVDIFHLDDSLPSANWQSRYSENQRMKARVLFVDPTSKSIGLTLKPHLINLKIVPPSISTGDVIEKATVRRVDATLGLLLELHTKPTPLAGYVHVSNVSDDHVDKLEKNFKVGTKVRGRVVGYRLMDDLAIVSLKQSVLQQLLLGYSDVKPGMRVSGIVVAVETFGAFVKLSEGLNALCPVTHMSEFQRTTPSPKFEVGKRMNFRVLSCNATNRKVIVTHKKTLLSSKLPQITSYEVAVPGLISHGWIWKIEEYGVFVRFYNDVKGLVRERELGLDPSIQIRTAFSEGQVVKCRVLKSDPDSRRLLLSFSMSESIVDPKKEEHLLSQLSPGTIVSALLVKLEEKWMVLNVASSEGSLRGIMRYEHLTDSPNHIKQFRSLLKPGFKFDRLVVLESLHSKLVLSSKFSLLKEKSLPSDISELRPQTVAHGYISNITDTGCFVRFLGRLTGRAKIGNVSDSFVTDVAKHFEKGQSVRAQILDINEEKGWFSASLKHSACFSTDASLLQGYFIEEEKIAELQLKETGGTNVEWTDDLSIGNLIDGEVQEVKDYGVIVNLNAHEDIVGFATHYQVDGVVQIGTPVRARILDVVKADGIVDLTLRPQLFPGTDVIANKSKKRSRIKLHQKVDAIIELVKDDYLVLSIQDHDNTIAFAATRDYNRRALDPHKQYTPGQSVCGVVHCLASKESTGRVLLLLEESNSPNGVSSSKTTRKHAKCEPGSIVQAKLASIEPLQLNLVIGKSIKGRVHITEVLDDFQPGVPFSKFQVGQSVNAKVLVKLRSSRKRNRSSPLELELSLRPSEVSPHSSEMSSGRSVGPLTLETISVGQVVTAYVQEVKDDWAWLLLSPHLRGRLSLWDSSTDLTELEQFNRRFCVGEALLCRVLSLDYETGTLDLTLRGVLTNETSDISLPSNVDGGHVSKGQKKSLDFKKGDIAPGRVVRVLPGVGGLRIQLAYRVFGQVHITDVSDAYEDNPVSSFNEGQFVYCKVLDSRVGENGNMLVDLSLRNLPGEFVRGAKNEKWRGKETAIPLVEHIEDLKPGLEVQGFIKSVSSKGCFVTLSRHIDARVLLSNLSGSYVRDPCESFPVGKVVNGWVVSVEPLSRHVEMSLVQSRVPSANLQLISSFRVGQLVAGIVRNVESFGIFVAIEQSAVVGLCHISEVSDDYTENLGSHYAVGDRVLAKVLKLDLGKGRVSLGLKKSYLVGSNGNESLKPSLPSLSAEESSEASDRGPDLVPDGFEVTKEGSELELDIRLQEAELFRALDEPAPTSSVLPLDVNLEDMMEHWKPLESEGDGMDSEALKIEQGNKLSKRAKSRLKKEREKAVEEAELKHLAGSQEPESADDYEKLVHMSPNSSFVWIKYMAFLLSTADVANARSVANRALETIHFREEAEKLNVWVALMNLENTFGDPSKEAVLQVFQRALQFCDPKKLHLALLGLYERTNQDDMSDQLLKKMTRKFKMSAKIWSRQLQNSLKRGQEDASQKVFNAALVSLPRHKHIKFITHAAILEFKIGSPERGRGMFEGVLRNYPKRTDLWSVYIDQEVRLSDQKVIRALFERLICLDLPPKKMRFLFKKYLDYEKAHGDEETTAHVKSKAMQYVEQNMS